MEAFPAKALKGNPWYQGYVLEKFDKPEPGQRVAASSQDGNYF